MEWLLVCYCDHDSYLGKQSQHLHFSDYRQILLNMQKQENNEFILPLLSLNRKFLW